MVNVRKLTATVVMTTRKVLRRAAGDTAGRATTVDLGTASNAAPQSQSWRTT